MFKTQRRLAAKILKCSPKKVWFNPSNLTEIKEGITSSNMRGLISAHAIERKPDNDTSRGRIRAAQTQKRKGRGKGPTRRKGKATARLPRKEDWMNRIRLIRKELNALKETGQIAVKDYRMLYMKGKGGFFRSKRHLNLYLAEQGLLKKK
jgi:large subunit ribosomal protein L19e